MKTQPNSPLRPLPGPSAPPAQAAQTAHAKGDEFGLGGPRGSGYERSLENRPLDAIPEETQPAPTDAAQQRLYEAITKHRFEIRHESIQAAIGNARAKHAQDVLPLDPRVASFRSPQELALTGRDNLRQLKMMIGLQMQSGLMHERNLTLAYGQIIHDAVTKYFHAGLKADNKAQLSEDRTTPIQTFRQLARMKMDLPEEDDFDNDQEEQSLMARFAYGSGNCFEQAAICCNIASAAGLPNTLIGIGDPHVPEQRFGHNFMVLTPTREDAADISSDRYSTISSFSRDWVVVDPWMKIVCPGDEYQIKAHDKLGKWEDRGKVLLNHSNDTAFAPRSEGVLATFRQGKPF
jgi:hypothetical protein